MTRSAMDAAVAYAQRGRRILPVHAIRADGSCSCGRAACSSPGKHPLTAHGLLDASVDPATIRRWYEAWPHAGVAIRTGRESGLLCLDLDRGHTPGVDGVESLQKAGLALAPGSLLEETVHGGAHVYFAYPETALGPLKNFSAPLYGDRRLRGVDGRGDGGYVVCAPTPGYTWAGESLAEKTPADPPSWVLDLFAGARPGSRFTRRPGTGDWATIIAAPCPQGTRHETAARLAGHLAALGLAVHEAEAHLVNWNTSVCQPPLGREEVIAVTRDIFRKHATMPLSQVQPADDKAFASWWLGMRPDLQAALATVDAERELAALVDAIRSGASLDMLLTVLVRKPRDPSSEDACPRYSVREARTRLLWADRRARADRTPTTPWGSGQA